MTATKKQEVAALSEGAQLFMQAAESGKVGVKQQASKLPFPILSIIQKMEEVTDTDEKLDIPFGSFHIKGTNLLSKEVIFRPIGTWNKVLNQSDSKDDNFRVISETIYFTDWGQQRLDTAGGIDCGRLFGKDAKVLPQDMQQENRDKGRVKSYTIGYVTFPDEEPVLVMMVLGGGKMVRWGDATSPKVTGGVQAMERNFKISTISPKKDPLLTKEQKEEGGNWSNIIVEPQMDKVLPISDIAEAGSKVLQYVYDHNADILEKHDAVVKARNSNDDGVLEGEIVEIEDLG